MGNTDRQRGNDRLQPSGMQITEMTATLRMEGSTNVYLLLQKVTFECDTKCDLTLHFGDPSSFMVAIAAPASYFILASFQTKLRNELLPVHFLFTRRFLSR